MRPKAVVRLRPVTGSEIGIVGDDLRGKEEHLLSSDENALLLDPGIRQYPILRVDVVLERLPSKAASRLRQFEVATGFHFAGHGVGDELVGAEGEVLIGERGIAARLGPVLVRVEVHDVGLEYSGANV
jgi:hypothetical protein